MLDPFPGHPDGALMRNVKKLVSVPFSSFLVRLPLILPLSLLTFSFSLLTSRAEAANWYVNDTSAAGDVYTSSNGEDTQPGTAAEPFRCIQSAIDSAAIGDTIYIDAGLYDSYVTVNGTETAGVNITKDSITLVGKDSGATVINPPGPKTQSGLYGIYADTQINLFIRNIGVTGAYNGIHFYNVDYSTIDGDSASSCGNDGIYLYFRSDTNTVKNSTAVSNTNSGIDVFSSSNSNTVTNNTVASNLYGIMLNGGANGSTVTNNTLTSNGSVGIQLANGSGGATISNNTIPSGVTGINLTGGSNNTVTNNAITSNSSVGLYLTTSSSNNMITNNTLSSNAYYGIYLSSSSNNTVSLNDVRLNTRYQIFITGTSSSDTVQKNNIVTSATNPDSGVYNWTGKTFDFARNWWNTADTVAIGRKMFDTGYVNRIGYTPFRLGAVDTTAGADTTAPDAPDTVAVLNNDTSIILEWAAVTTNEETMAGGTALSGYKVYRSTIADTSSWTLMGTVAAGSIRYQDTSATGAATFYYRVTAFDTASPYANESFYSDSQVSSIGATSPVVNWYVNDTSAAGDVYTSGTGSDTSWGLGTAARPFASIPKAMQYADTGDTIYVDAGIYDSYVYISGNDSAGVHIDKDSITLIGKDSASTVIDPPGDSSDQVIYGIFADSQVNLSIRNIGVTGAYYGVYLNSVDRSTINNSSFTYCDGTGIDLVNGSDTNTVVNSIASFNRTGCDLILGKPYGNTISSNTFNSNWQVGLSMSRCTNTIVSNNTCNSNGMYGIELGYYSTQNTISGNTANANAEYGIVFIFGPLVNTVTNNIVNANGYGIVLNNGSPMNTISFNQIRSNINAGVALVGDSNVVYANEIVGGDTGVYITGGGTIRGNEVTKNNIISSARAFVDNNTGNNQNALRNWYGTTDSAAIKAKFTSSVDSYIPFRLGAVDTTSGADTTSPRAPDSVAVIGGLPSDTSVILEWAAVGALEESNGGNIALGGYKVYRSRTKDTSSWIQVAQVTSGIRYQDTDVVLGLTYYYRVTSYDTSTTVNESFYSDSQPGDTAMFASQVNWYVNDTSVTGDVYTSGTGSDTSWGLGTAAKPFRTIPMSMRFATAGDTIWIDAGLYDSYVTVNGAETAGVNIDKDSITLVGKDSASTVIDPPGAKTVSGLYGIYADTQTGLLIKTLGVTGANRGLYFINVDRATLSGDSFSSNGNRGVYLINGSDTNTLTGNAVWSNTSDGLEIEAGAGCAISNNSVNLNGAAGILLSGNSAGNTVSNNGARQNATHGVHLNPADSNTISGNTMDSNSTAIYLQTSHNNMITNNIADSNVNGIYLHMGSNLNTVSNNSANANSSVGGILVDGSALDTILNNTANLNTQDGIFINAGVSILIQGNTVQSNLASGIDATGGDTGLLITGNIARSNGQFGVYISASTDLTVSNNLIRSNTQAGLRLENAESIVVLQNDIAANDSGIWISDAATNNLIAKNNIANNNVKNIYNQTDVAQTLRRNWFGSADSVTIKAKLGDTASAWQPYRLGAGDTAAGADTTAPKAPDTVAILSAPSDTSIILEWSAVAALEEVNGGNVALSGYRVYRSEVKDTSSWMKVGQATGIRYQDTDVVLGRKYYYRVTAFDTASPFENESFFSDSQPSDSAVLSAAVEIYVNDDSTSGDSWAAAAGSDASGKGTKQQPLRTITKALQFVTPGDTIFIDRGVYAETVVIDVDSVSLIGKDSNATVIDPASGNGIYADTQTGLLIKNLGVTGATEGIRFFNVTASTITGDSLSDHVGRGIYLQNGCDSNTISNNLLISNLNQGLYMVTNCFNNTIDNNIAEENSQGIHLNSSSRNNVITRNIARRNKHGIYIEINSHGNLVRNNLSDSNTQSGFGLVASNSNIVYQNEFRSNDTGIWIQNSGAGNVFTRNNVANNTVYNVFSPASAAQTFNRNWWGTTQETLISAKFYDTASAFKPYRLAPVDTAAGADTRAPYVFDTSIVIHAGSETALITWDTPTQDEDSASLSGFTSVGIFRLAVPDTTHWDSALIKDVPAGKNSFVDTGLTNGTKYYYRLSALDGLTPFENESFFTDTKSVTPAWFDTGAALVYVSSFGDSTNPGAYDTTKAFRNINEALSAVRPDNGWDTIVVFARPGGDSYFQQLDLTNDTGVKIIAVKRIIGTDPVFDTLPRVAFDTGTILKVWTNTIVEGLFLDGIDSTRTSVAGVLANALEHNGVFLPNSCSGAFVRNMEIRNVYNGIVGDSAHYTTVKYNHIADIVRDGIHFDNGSQNNLIYRNTVERQKHPTGHGHGIKLKTSTARNVVRDNIVRDANMATEFVSTGGQNHIYHNQIYNSDTGVWLLGAGADTFAKNSLVNIGSTLLDMGSSPNFDARRNWWGIRDMNAILSKMAADGSVKIFPHLTTPPDTSADESDTTAPGKPDTFALNGVSGTGGQVTVSWDTPDFDEDGGTPDAFGEYRIYRLISTPDTSDWRNAFRASVASGQTNYVDLAVTDGLTYYYRVSASETLTGGFFNESVFTDTLSVVPSLDTTLPNVWYVNDSFTIGDSYTTAAGADTNTGLQRSSPFLRISRALKFVSAGDTIYIDSGTYNETLTIDTDRVSLIGKDSSATVINPNDDLASDSMRGIQADTQTGLLIRNLRVQICLIGIEWSGVTNSRIENVTVELTTLGGDPYPDGAGMILKNGSDTNVLSSNTVQSNQGTGISLSASAGNTISGNYAASNGNGIVLTQSNSNVLSANTAASNTPGDGITLTSSSFNTLSGNTVTGNSNDGIRLNGSSNGNVITGNTATSNSAGGFDVDGSNSDTLSNNTSMSNANGFFLSSADTCAFLNNSVSNNALSGFRLTSGSDRNVFSGNTVIKNSQYGFDVSSSDSNILTGNLSFSNTLDGARFVGAQSNRMIQNQVDSNGGWALSLTGNSRSNLFAKNNLRGSDARPDSGVKNVTSFAFDFTRNWWGSADSVTIQRRIYDTSATNGIQYQPYRLGMVDTAAGADTTAPESPDTVAIISNDTSIVLEWSAVNTNEEGMGGSPGVLAYGIYRSGIRDTSSWISLAISTTTRFQDTNVVLGRAYYYRVTAYDTAAPLKNESFYSDSQPGDSAVHSSRVSWFVNDGSTSGDSFTYAAGSDTSAGEGTASKPLRTISRALQFSTSGDSVFVDAGLYDSHVNPTATETAVASINIDYLYLIGKDSASTVIDPPGPRTQPDLYGIYASGRSGVTIRNVAVRGAYDGIKFSNVDLSTLSGDSASDNGNNGIYLLNGADTNTVTGCAADSNGLTGIVVDGSHGNTLQNNAASGNFSAGIELSAANGNTLTGNAATSNVFDGFLLTGGSKNNVVRNSVITGNREYGVWISSASNLNTFWNNAIKSNVQAGLYIDASDTNGVRLNDISGNDTGVLINGAAFNNILAHNNLTGNAVSSVLNKAGLTQTMKRNWFGTTDEVTISAKFVDTASTFRPYRLGVVDTAAGADTRAPLEPQNVTVDTSSGVSVTLTWAIPTADEDTQSLSGFAGAKIYRLLNAVDTTQWANSVLLVKTTGASDTTWTDTNVAIGNTYYYKLTSFDASTVVNQSFFTDTKVAVVAVPYWGGPVWYVDKDTGADTFTGHPNYPFKTITRALQAIPADTQQFDTVLIDRNTYAETVVIDTDYICIEGVDSNRSVIDPPGAISTAGLYGIYADTQTGMVIRNIGVTGGYHGVFLDAVTNSIVSGDSISGNGSIGVYLGAGSDTNTVSNCVVDSNTGNGIRIVSSGNTVSGNTVRANGTIGISVNAAGNTISGNSVISNGVQGIYVTGSSNNTISGNTMMGNYRGIYLSSATGNAVTGNIAMYNTEGFTLDMSTQNTLARNLSAENDTTAGFYVLANSDTNTFIQNESHGDRYAIYIDKGALNPPGGNRFIRNNVLKPDSYGIFLANGQVATNFFWRNYMDTTNEGDWNDNIVTKRTLFGLVWDGLDKGGLAYAADTQPRFAPVDTSVSGDSLAPYETAGAFWASSICAGAVKVRWTAPTVNEAGEAAPGHTGFRIYRTTNPAERDWKGNAFLTERPSADTTYVDQAVTNGVTYFYRLTAFDAATPFPNESYFTDSFQATPGGSFCDLGSMTVYLSDSGQATQPSADSPIAAFPSLDSALSALDPSNGFDTIIVFKSMRDSYSISDTGYSIDSGLTLISRKALFGTDNGGGGDTFPTVTWSGETSGLTGAMFTVDSSARIEGFVVDGRDSSTGVKILVANQSNAGQPLIIRNVTVRNAAYGLFGKSGAANITVEHCTAVNFSQAVVQVDGANAMIRNCYAENVTGTSAATVVWQVSSSANGILIADNIVRGAWRGIYLNGNSGSIVRNNIRNVRLAVSAPGFGHTIHANDISNADTAISGGLSTGEIQWNNLYNISDSFVFVSGFPTANYNYFGTTDSEEIKRKSRSSGFVAQSFRFAPVDTRASGDSSASRKPTGVVIENNVPNRNLIRWSPPSQEEDGSAPEIAGYRVFRLRNLYDTSNWRLLAPLPDTAAGDTFLIDTDLVPGSVYYYRVLAFDSSTFNGANLEGFMSDVSKVNPIFGGSGGVRFVSDTGATAAYIKVRAGDSVSVEVNDSDPNTDPGVVQTCTVTIVNLTLGTETETVTCTEISVDSPVFSGKIMMTTMASDTPNSGKLLVRASDQIRVTYIDTPSGDLRTMTATMVAAGVGGDSAIIDSGAHQMVPSGGSAAFQVTVKDSSGEGVPNAIVNFKVEYEGTEVANPSGTTTDSGGLTQSIPLTAGDGMYVILVSTRPGDTDDARTVVYTDRRRVPASKAPAALGAGWVMFSPARQADTQATSLTGIAKLVGSGALLSYWYDPAISKYKSIAGQASPNNSAAGEFSVFESGRGYWIKSAVAGGVGLAGTNYALTDTFRLRVSAGANMIGNPFPHLINWLDDVYVTLDTGPDTLLSLKSFTAGTPAIDTRLQWRDQSAEQYITPFESGDDSAQLKPWAGVWVKVNTACTMVFVPHNKRLPQGTRIKTQSAVYTPPSEGGAGGGSVSNWRLRLMAYSGVSEIRDEYTYVGVAPAAADGEDMNDLWKAPGMLGDLQVAVGEANAGNEPSATNPYAASIAAPVKTATTWPVVVSGPPGAVTLKWDASGLPSEYGAYLLGAPSGPIDLRATSSLVLESKIQNPKSKISLTLAAGLPEYLAAYLAPALDAAQSFVYPNPGPDAATGEVIFKYSLPADAPVTLKIFDVGGRLIRELSEPGKAGVNTTLKWDTTNKHGQKTGSGVYIYILESSGNKLIDKLAIVR